MFSPVAPTQFYGRLPVAAATLIPWFVLVALNAAGNAVPATDAVGLTVQGIAHGDGGVRDSRVPVDNSTGTAGQQGVAVQGGIFRLKNSSAAPLGASDLGKLAVVEDALTVAKTSAHRVAAGVLLGIEGGHARIWIMPPAGYPSADFQTFDISQPVP